MSFLPFTERSAAQTVSVAAASDLRFAMEELAAEYHKIHPDIKLLISYGSSGNLFQQIVNQGPFDLYFSADIIYPGKLDSMHMICGKPVLYAIGCLVLWSASVDVSRGITCLRNPEVTKIAIANPAVAPYGKRAVECLHYFGIYDVIRSKIVNGENVSQAAQFVLSGNAQAGLIAQSIALAPEMISRGKFYMLDQNSYTKLEQTYVIMKNSGQKPGVIDFTRFLENSRAKEILSKFGFKLPAQG